WFKDWNQTSASSPSRLHAPYISRCRHPSSISSPQAPPPNSSGIVCPLCLYPFDLRLYPFDLCLYPFDLCLYPFDVLVEFVSVAPLVICMQFGVYVLRLRLVDISGFLVCGAERYTGVVFQPPVGGEFRVWGEQQDVAFGDVMPGFHRPGGAGGEALFPQ